MPNYPADASARARQLVAEGKIGGAHYGRMGGRPRRPRAGEVAAAQAAEHAEEIVRAFREALDPSQPIGMRLKAATAWLEVERHELKTSEGRFLEEMGEPELVEFVAVRLLRMCDLVPGLPLADANGAAGDEGGLNPSFRSVTDRAGCGDSEFEAHRRRGGIVDEPSRSV